MLFFAAAILYSSAHLFGVVGASTLPETAVVHQAAAVSDTTPRLQAPDEGAPVSSSALDGCGAERGTATQATREGRFDAATCLRELGAAPAWRLLDFSSSLSQDAGQDVDFATHLSEDGSASATRHWWAGLPDSTRDSLIATMPGVVGNLEGVPYTVRDEANRSVLSETLATIQHRDDRASAGLTGFGDETARLTMLQQVDLALTPGRGGDDTARQLVSLDTVFPGRAAISVGDLDTARDVSVMVPGMLYTVSNQITYWTDHAAALHSEQDFWTKTLATTTRRPQSSAVVAWMGYRTPDLTNVTSLDLARQGAVHLEESVTGLDAVRAVDRPRLTILAHSYGSTTATIALSSGRMRADAFVALGSPGSVVDSASDLSVTRGNVYAAAAALDPVAGLGFFGKDPGASLFGSTLLSVAASTDPFTEQHLTGTWTHNNYFDPGSRSMRNLALIGIGQGALAGGRPPQPDVPQVVSGPSLALVRPQDVYRD
ncbi:hypothetical protein AS850_04625 [Frondihabitans sp. 762G35]|uniref:alpha/beta hydrolase n=1 Tax=Frondihabitans sp. 762G35 TaxID=1446794 RepID=UPI000D21D110|nr:alpha/beta hydrolase [Frondihabitans sp. 762G35]ARC56359.1 hypothetical protein AS850_04625 [Frondihabitans sp. 762G35]